jgi:hypothetical protein
MKEQLEQPQGRLIRIRDAQPHRDVINTYAEPASEGDEMRHGNEGLPTAVER